MEKVAKYILPALLIIVIATNLLSAFIPRGMSEDEHLLKVRLHDLEQENIILEKANNQYEVKIKKFEDEILKSDSVISNASIDQLDSLFADYFKR